MSEVRIWDDGLDVPLFVSVTGHVDLVESDLDDIRGKVERFLTGLSRDFQNTRLILMSALADGSDLLVSEVALEMGLHIAPVLPMPLDRYMEGASLEYRMRVERVLSDPMTYTPHLIETHSGCDRDSYRNLSAYLIFNSHIMIALWDGRVYDRNGGTYDTVRMAYSGIDANIRRAYLDTVVRERNGTDRIRYLDASEDCLIYRIQVERSKSDAELLSRGCLDVSLRKLGDGYIEPQMVTFGRPGTALQADGEKLEATMPPFYSRMFSRIDQLNTDMGAEVVGGDATYRSGSTAAGTRIHKDRPNRFYLLETKDPVVHGYATEIMSKGIMDATADRYHVADQMALDYQSSSFGRMHVMIFVAVLTSFAFSLFILTGGSLLVNAIYTVFMLAGLVLTKLHVRRKSFSKFIEYRALAESMRVEYYRGLLGSRESVPQLCYGYMKNELFWIRSVLKSWNSDFMNDFDAVRRLPDWEGKMLAVATECWMRDQMRYHLKKRERNTRKYRRSSHTSYVLVTLTTVISAVLIPSMALFPDMLNDAVFSIGSVYLGGACLIQGMEFTVATSIRLFMIVLVALTSFVSLNTNMIHGGTKEQIDAKVQMFTIAEMRLREARDTMTRKEILWELGDQCIEENNDWVFEHKAKDFRGGSLNVSPIDTDV